MAFDFSYYVLICKLYKLDVKKKKKGKSKNVPEVIWSNQEEEFIEDVSIGIGILRRGAEMK